MEKFEIYLKCENSKLYKSSLKHTVDITEYRVYLVVLLFLLPMHFSKILVYANQCMCAHEMAPREVYKIEG